MACNCGGTGKAKPAKPKKVAPKRAQAKTGKAKQVPVGEQQKASSNGGTPKPSPKPNPKPSPKPNPCFCNGGKQVKPPAGYAKALDQRMAQVTKRAIAASRKA